MCMHAQIPGVAPLPCDDSVLEYLEGSKVSQAPAFGGSALLLFSITTAQSSCRDLRPGPIQAVSKFPSPTSVSDFGL